MKYLTTVTTTSIVALIISPFIARNAFAGEAESVRFEVILVDGSLIRGELMETELDLTVHGDKESIPVELLSQFTPGLNRRPDLLESVKSLIHQLGSEDFQTREDASRQLEQAGPSIRCELDLFRNDTDAERRIRVRRLLQNIDTQHNPTSWSRNDRIELAEGFHSGRINNSNFTVLTKYGRLKIPLDKISLLRRIHPAAEVDLLKTINLQKAAIRGGWVIREGVLITPPDIPWALLQLDVKPPATYTITADVERKKGHDALVFPIVVGEHECNVCIDGWPRREVHHTGIELIHGEGPLTNATGHAGDVLILDKPSTIRIDVTPTSVRLVIDDREMFDWKGDPEMFSMQAQWKRPNKSVLAIGSYNASFHISRWELSESSPAPIFASSIFASSNFNVKDKHCAIWLGVATQLFVRFTNHQQVQIESKSDIRTIPLSQIRTLENAAADSSAVRVKLQGGTAVEGKLLQTKLELKTEFGLINLSSHEFRRIDRGAILEVKENIRLAE